MLLRTKRTLLSKSAGWDSVQIQQHRKHQTQTEGNKTLMQGMCLIFDHRIPSLHLDDTLTTPAMQLDPTVFLPSARDVVDIRQRCCLEVTKTLVQRVPNLRHLSKHIMHHLQHPYQAEMAQRTSVHNLGVVEGNPSTTSGVIEIVKYLQTFCPKIDDKVHQMPCNVDQLSFERMRHARIGRQSCMTEEDKLLGMVENPQEFHKLGHVMQVSYLK